MCLECRWQADDTTDHTAMCSKDQRQKRNYLIHLLYVRKEFEECLLLIDNTLVQVCWALSMPSLPAQSVAAPMTTRFANLAGTDHVV